MFKRVTIVALVVAAFLVLAVPALAFNGMRENYSVATSCQGCHTNGNFGAPKVFDAWAETKHHENEAFSEPGFPQRVPTGSVCQGCHTANFNPAKMTPTPTATTTAYSTPVGPTSVPTATSTAYGYMTDTSGSQTGAGTHSGAWSENYIGCSSCHYGAEPVSEADGRDVNDTAHKAPLGEMANADICGSCHSRYSYTVATYDILPIPTTSAVAVIQPQMALGTTAQPWQFLGAPNGSGGWNPAAPLSTVLNIPKSGWTPAPTATTAGSYTSPSLMTYWKLPAATATGQPTNTPWQLVGHEGSAAQYPEWAGEGHAAALTALTSQSFWGFLPEATKQECLECHSADFRILKEAGENPKSTDVKYGITCAGCHAPHEAGTVTGVWDEEWDAQLVNDAQLAGNGSNLCTECHNGEIPAGSTASPGAEVHHPMKEMMDGYGAIDVQSFPSVHKGKCIQCHMPPTSYSRGSVQMGANHTFTIIEPEVAVEALPIPIATSVTVATTYPNPAASPVVTTTTTKTQDSMPYSACSTCHNNNQKPTPVPVATSVSPTPSAGATKIAVTVTQNVANQGDKALWLQNTIEQRQEWTHAKITEIHTELNAGAVRLGYADEAAAQTALVAIPEADRTFGQTNFLKAFTNVGYVESEGSFGLHNWDYSRAIVNVALAQAKAAVAGNPEPRQWVVSLRVSRDSINKGQKIFFRGAVLTGWGLAGKGKVTLQRRMNGQSWRNWKTQTLATNGTYDIRQRLNFKKGKWFFRASMPGDGGRNLANVSPNRVIRIK
jgi:nitrate/TMAO reductase-like tetraheme cytochrome c subunit